MSLAGASFGRGRGDQLAQHSADAAYLLASHGSASLSRSTTRR